MSHIIPYLNFPGTCREAMTFYQKSLGADLNLQSLADSPMADQAPVEARDRIIHAVLKKDDLVLMASDTMLHHDVVHGNNCLLMIECETLEIIENYFANLSEGGQIIVPLREEFWGGLHGQLVDQFGIHWMFNYDQPKLAA